MSDAASLFTRPDKAVVIAIDHPLYSWPCQGLDDRASILQAVSAAGADAVIASYGTIRDYRSSFGACVPILKLDLTTITVGNAYTLAPHDPVWTVEDAVRLGVAWVMTYVQLGAPFELEALKAAARIAAACDRAGIQYLCEIMPVETPAYPDAEAPLAIAAATRAAFEFGAHAVKTTMPKPPEAIALSTGFGRPVILAGGGYAKDREQLYANVATAAAHGAAGVAFGRNCWGSGDPAGVVRRLTQILHRQEQAA